MVNEITLHESTSGSTKTEQFLEDMKLIIAECWIFDQAAKRQDVARKKLIDALYSYARHMEWCILTLWEAGEPTADGGYRMKYAGQWYQSSPIDETPKCNCGLDDLSTEFPR